MEEQFDLSNVSSINALVRSYEGVLGWKNLKYETENKITYPREGAFYLLGALDHLVKEVSGQNKRVQVIKTKLHDNQDISIVIELSGAYTQEKELNRINEDFILGMNHDVDKPEEQIFRTRPEGNDRVLAGYYSSLINGEISVHSSPKKPHRTTYTLLLKSK